ncbi:hypothetical protein EMCG_00845 [[Emmonsia] crescens]|uniref:Uncharacterized protein n=1 Tax=[Emmonsia] crescens TaxID=73230 RepID=A0A0G2HPT8_9EURO|nr:hypothetical protein EMCG_00845 [Emmonsia crescens UAMH 3008]
MFALRCVRPRPLWLVSRLSTLPAKQFHSSSPHRAARAPSTLKTLSERRRDFRYQSALGSIRLTEEEAEALVDRIPRPLFESALSSILGGSSIDAAVSLAGRLIRLAAECNGMHGSEIFYRSKGETALTTPEKLTPIYSLTRTYRSGKVLTNRYIDPGMLSRLSFILSRHPDYRAVANWLLYRLAESKEPFAVLYIINQQFIAGTPLKRTVLMDYLEEFAQRHLLDAMVLYGRILHERHHRTGEALTLWRKAMEISVPLQAHAGETDEDPYSVLGIPQAWEMYAAVKAVEQDDEGRRAAVETGAFLLDHPVAFGYLAKIVGMEGQLDKYEEYMTKAAMDCDAEACHDLGRFYLELHYSGKGRAKSPKLSKSQDASPKDLVAGKYTNYELRQKAIDWLEIASTGGWGPSALIMACLLREDGYAHKGLHYLNIAEDDEKSASKAKEIRHIYLGNTFELNIENEPEIFTKQFPQFG